MSLNLIVALRVDDEAIGKKSGELLWSSPEDMTHFKQITVGNGNVAEIVIILICCCCCTDVNIDLKTERMCW